MRNVQTSRGAATANGATMSSTHSSKWINETFNPAIPFAWQRGFGAFSVSASNLEKVRVYVRQQEQHHRVISFRDEYRELLIRHGLTFDEHYLFEEEHVR